jgi:hypothetical protein
MENDGWVKCSITFYYDEGTYTSEFDEERPPSNKEIFDRCKKMMIEDIYTGDDPLAFAAIKAEFERPPWATLAFTEEDDNG